VRRLEPPAGPADNTEVSEADAATSAERALVDRARAGDRAAFDTLVRAHQRAVFGFAWRHARNVDDARELTQHAFVRAYERIGTFRGEARFRTWVLSIAYNLGADVARGRARTEPLGSRDAVAADDEDALEARQTSAMLRAAVARLPEKQRLCVELRAFEELSFREVGEVIGISEDAAKMNFHHALKRLREEMENGS
jgi:RNA polymerase sigma-70 factor (ECF subfamily)